VKINHDERKIQMSNINTAMRILREVKEWLGDLDDSELKAKPIPGST